MSVTRRIAGSIGKHHSFWAMYSLRMSVWIVPPSLLRRDALLLADEHVVGEQDRRRRVDRHRGGDAAERDPVEELFHVVEAVDGDPLAPDLAEAALVVGVVAHQGRHVEGGREPGLAVVEQVVEALVGLLDRAEAGELAHRPEPAAVHRLVRTAGEGVLAGAADRLLGLGRRQLGTVERRDRVSRHRRALRLALFQRLLPRFGRHSDSLGTTVVNQVDRWTQGGW